MKLNNIKFTKLFFVIIGIAIVAVIQISCDSQKQFADTNFETKVANPAFTNEKPKVLFDEAHRNIHTANGLYKPFSNLMTSDGYQVVSNRETFSQKTLEDNAILVIANALGSDETNNNSALTNEECDAVRDWVQNGGSLLLITDHAPTGAAAENLAKRFGVEMSKGMSEDPKNSDQTSGDTSQLVFSQENGLLVEHPITKGRNENEKVKKIMTFTGQSLKVGENGTAILKFGETAVNRAAQIKLEKDGGDKRVVINYGEPTPAKDFAQAVALQFGKGRIVILGEAAMLTAQIDGKTQKPFGMNVQGIDNRQFALNIMHWLSKVL